MPFEMKTNLTNPSVDPIFNRLDEDSQVLDQSRRMNLEDGFNELEDEIEAIIHRRNKRNAKFTK
jgi:hypothetical protein